MLLKLSPLIKNLNAKAAVLSPYMDPFLCGDWGCPWLLSSDKRGAYIDPSAQKPHGLVLMQDWGNEPQTLASAINDVDCACSSHGVEASDCTLRQFFSVEGWRKAFESGDWLVSNAVWGIRPEGGPKGGWLGASVHKAAFPVWLELLTHLATFPEFKLVIAGSWGVFGNEFLPNGTCSMEEYLALWIKWVTRTNPELVQDLRKMASNCQGTVYHVSHPCTWGHLYPPNHDWRIGPLY